MHTWRTVASVQLGLLGLAFTWVNYPGRGWTSSPTLWALEPYCVKTKNLKRLVRCLYRWIYFQSDKIVFCFYINIDRTGVLILRWCWWTLQPCMIPTHRQCKGSSNRHQEPIRGISLQFRTVEVLQIATLRHLRIRTNRLRWVLSTFWNLWLYFGYLFVPALSRVLFSDGMAKKCFWSYLR